MLGIVLTNTRVVSSYDDIPRFFLVGLEGCLFQFGIFYFYRVMELIGSSSRHTIVIVGEPAVIDTEGPVRSRLFLSLKVAERLILSIVLWPWKINLRRVRVQVRSRWRFEILR